MIELNRIINGDCLEVMKDIPDKYFELAIVDPPYGIDILKIQNTNADSNRVSNNGYWKNYKYSEWDKYIPSVDYFKELFRVSKNQIIWGGNYFSLPPCCQWIVWNKIERNCQANGEMAWTNLKGQVKIFDMSRADAYINKMDYKFHPTQKPVALYKWLLKNYAKTGDKILDTHSGSGTTAVACIDMGFEYLAIEKDKDYYDASVKRINKELLKIKLF